MRAKTEMRVFSKLLSNQQGSSILFVLLFLIMLGGFGFVFRQFTGLEGRAVANLLEQQQAKECARAALQVGIALLANDSADVDGWNDSWRNSPKLQGELNSICQYSLAQDGALPDNGILDLTGQLPLELLSAERLATLPGSSEESINAFLKARESQNPQRLRETWRVLQQARRQESPSLPELKFSAWTGSTVNVNTASREVLDFLSKDSRFARRILEHRQGPDGKVGTSDDRNWESLEALKTAFPQLPPSVNWSVHSTHFLLTATGEVRNGNFFARSRLQAVLSRSEKGVQMLGALEL